MTDQDFLLSGPDREFGSGVIGVCDVCGRRQAVIVLQKERFKLCVLDFLNKTWASSGKSPGAPLPPYRSERIWFPTRTTRDGRAAGIVLTPTKVVKRPVLLVTPDVYGLTTTLLDAAIRFARDGFEVLLPDVARTGRAGPGDHLTMRLGLRTRKGVPLDSPRVGAIVSLYRDGLEFLRGREMVDPEKAGVFGASYGASLACQVAALEPQLAALGLAYPLPVRPVQTLGMINVPIFVAAGALDVGAVRFLADVRAQRGPEAAIGSIELPGVGHDFLAREMKGYRVAEAERAWNSLSEFFRSRLMPPPPKPPAPPVAKTPPAPPPAAVGTPPVAPAPA